MYKCNNLLSFRHKEVMSNDLVYRTFKQWFSFIKDLCNPVFRVHRKVEKPELSGMRDSHYKAFTWILFNVFIYSPHCHMIAFQGIESTMYIIYMYYLYSCVTYTLQRCDQVN